MNSMNVFIFHLTKIYLNLIERRCYMDIKWRRVLLPIFHILSDAIQNVINFVFQDTVIAS